MTDKPFPQFGDDSFESPRTLIQSIIAWDEAGGAERPHIVLVYDPEVKQHISYGPYDTGYLANDAAVKLEAELNNPKNNDSAPITVTVVPLEAP